MFIGDDSLGAHLLLPSNRSMSSTQHRPQRIDLAGQAARLASPRSQYWAHTATAVELAIVGRDQGATFGLLDVVTA